MRLPNRILVPVDFSPCSAAALRYAALLALKLGSAVDVLHVWQSPHALHPGEALPPLAVFLQTQAGQQMKDFLAELESRGMPSGLVNGRLAHGEPSQIILELLDTGSFDLVIMGRHGRGMLHHFLVGSVTERVSRRAPVPVLTMHAGEEDARVTRPIHVPATEVRP
jgi:nucleotide-binding universal stress UspA family protein